MQVNELIRFVSKNNTECKRCGEIIEAYQFGALYNGQPYCECCVEDYEEEGRPL